MNNKKPVPLPRTKVRITPQQTDRKTTKINDLKCNETFNEMLNKSCQDENTISNKTGNTLGNTQYKHVLTQLKHSFKSEELPGAADKDSNYDRDVEIDIPKTSNKEISFNEYTNKGYDENLDKQYSDMNYSTAVNDKNSKLCESHTPAGNKIRTNEDKDFEPQNIRGDGQFLNPVRGTCYDEDPVTDGYNIPINQMDEYEEHIYANYLEVFYQSDNESEKLPQYRKPLTYLKYTVDNMSECDEEDTFPDLVCAPKKLNKEQSIIKEMIATEVKYIESLRQPVKNYQPYLYMYAPDNLQHKVPYIFGNISQIYEGAQTFLTTLEQNSGSTDAIIRSFINSTEIFNLYLEYFKNKPKADEYFEELREIVKKRQEELHDPLGLTNYLSSPVRRLVQYSTFLESIKKELTKLNESVHNVDCATTIIKNVLRKCNDFMAVGSIKNCKLDLSKQGSFIMRAAFNILSPRKFPSMVFLFEKIIVFTEPTKNEEQFKYVDSIKMDHLNFRNSIDKPSTFSLTDYVRLKKFNDHFATYVLQTEKEIIKNKWVNVIVTKLWEQLQKAKERKNKANVDESKNLAFESTSSEATKKGTGNAIFYVYDSLDENKNY